MNKLSLEHIQVCYGEKRVLQDFSLSLPSQGVFALMGPSGSGKTTVLRLLAGLLLPQGGQVLGLEGKKISMAFQEDRLLPWATALENVAAVAPREQAAAWLTRLELGAEQNKYPDALSGGMQRRVALARACAYGGDLLLLDEPFQGLDEGLKMRIAPAIVHAAPFCLFATHDLAEAQMVQAVVIDLTNGS